MKVIISIIKPENITSMWDAVYPYLAPAIEEDVFHTEQSLKNLLVNDQALMFIANVDGVVKGATVVQIEDGKHSLVNILTLGGKDFRCWKKQMNEALTQYAYFMECKFIVALGKRGWSRLWPDFQPGKTFFSKEVMQ